ncbi:MAG: hypothetical protein EOO09_18600 [Chitinophagaceae bacterium]|nr:MAG: hypothetical protein EOO09_18600 [Chitinophagaceae bacterium]
MEKEFQPSPGDEEMEIRLWEYIDGLAGTEEQTVIGQLIVSQRLWKEKFEELKSLQEMVLSSELDEPSMRFTKNVMEEIGRLQINPAASSYINKRIVWGIAGFFIASIIAFVVYSVGLIDWSVGAPENAPNPRYSISFDQPDYSSIFTSSFAYALLMVNVILGLFLLDRFLSNKRRKFREEI